MSRALTRFVEKVCVQTAVYWPAPKPDGFGGYTYGTPREIACRWDGKTKVIVDKDGNEKVSQAEILVTEKLELDGMLYLGSLADLTPQQIANPKLVKGAHPIQMVEETPHFRSTTEFVRRVYI